jgi:two-component system, chemotaxis family, CheB/CheR fusion protein
MGIDPDVLPNIFNAFEQGDESITRRFGGMGLGLAIGRAIAEGHSGHLTATSPGRGQGATFRLDLPAVLPAPAIERRAARLIPAG